MKLLWILLIFATSLSFGQTKIEKNTAFFQSYVKIGYATHQTECQLIYIKLYIGKKRVILNSDLINLDLKITKKGKSWDVISTEGVKYSVTGFTIGGKPGILIVPKDSFNVGVCLSEFNVCQ